MAQRPQKITFFENYVIDGTTQQICEYVTQLDQQENQQHQRHPPQYQRQQQNLPPYQQQSSHYATTAVRNTNRSGQPQMQMQTQSSNDLINEMLNTVTKQEEEIRKLKNKINTYKHISKCKICYEEYDENRYMVMIMCKDGYGGCVICYVCEQSLQERNSCPFCKGIYDHTKNKRVYFN